MHVVKYRSTYMLLFMGLIISGCIIFTYSSEIEDYVRQNTEQVISIALSGLICIWLYIDYWKRWLISHRLLGISIVMLLWGVVVCLYISEPTLIILACLLVGIAAYYVYARKVENLPPPHVVERQNDWMYRSRLFNRTHRQIRKLACTENRGVTIGICGQWGSGKSFFIRDLLFKLSQPLSTENKGLYTKEFSICPNVELWEASSLDDAWERVMSSLFYGIFGRYPINYGKYSKAFFSILSVFSSRFAVGNEISKLVLPEYNKRILRETQKQMGNKKLVLVFDDLERADFEIIKAMLPLFERLKTLPNLIVICAVAEHELKHVFKRQKMEEEFAHGHLNKLFDLRIEIPTVAYTAIKNFQNQLLDSKYDDCKMVRSFLKKYPLRFDSARQMIRVVDKLTSIERQYYAECPYDFVNQENDDVKTAVLADAKYIFLVEALKLTNPIVVRELVKELHLYEFFMGIPVSIVPQSSSFITNEDGIYNFSKYLPSDDAQKKQQLAEENVWIGKHLILNEIIVRDFLVKCILHHMKYDFTLPWYSNVDYEKVFVDAVNAKYTRCTTLMEWEKENILMNSNSLDVSYSEKLKIFFDQKKEVLEKTYLAEGALSLLEKHLNSAAQIISKIRANRSFTPTYENNLLQLLENIDVSLEKEIGGETDQYLRDCSQLDVRFFVCRLEDLWQVKKYVKEEVWNKTLSILSHVFELMPTGEKGQHLSHYFYLKGKNYECEKDDAYVSQIACTEAYSLFVEKLCYLYGVHLANAISDYPVSFATDQSRYTFAYQVYRETSEPKYLEAMRQGIAKSIRHLSSKAMFIEHWVLFMGHQYRSAEILGGVNSSFANTRVYDLMQYISECLEISVELHQRISNRASIYEACNDSIAKLEDDYEIWRRDKDQARKEKYSSGILPLIELIKGIRELAK